MLFNYYENEEITILIIENFKYLCLKNSEFLNDFISNNIIYQILNLLEKFKNNADFVILILEFSLCLIKNQEYKQYNLNLEIVIKFFFNFFIF